MGRPASVDPRAETASDPVEFLCAADDSCGGVHGTAVVHLAASCSHSTARRALNLFCAALVIVSNIGFKL